VGKKGTYLQFHITPNIDVSQAAEQCSDMPGIKRESLDNH